MCSSRRHTREFVGFEEPRADMRAADDDRERALAELRRHGGEGRLSAEELEDRVEAALNARTHGELRDLFRDLPSKPRFAAREQRRSGGNAEHFRVYLAVSALLVTIWALTGADYFWPIWPIAGWGVVFLIPGCGPRRAQRPRGEAIRV
jgi:hypothetical protein